MIRCIVCFALGLGVGAFGPIGCLHKTAEAGNKIANTADTIGKKTKEAKEKADKLKEDVKDASDKLKK